MLATGNKTRGSFGPDGRRVSGGLPPPRKKLVVARAGSGFSKCSGPIKVKSTNKLFEPGAKVLIARAPVMSGLNCGNGNGVGGSLLQKKFQRPMTKRRSYDKRSELALKTSTLGQKRRFDGMSKLMARAGKVSCACLFIVLVCNLMVHVVILMVHVLTQFSIKYTLPTLNTY